MENFCREVSPVIDCTKVELKAEVKAQKPDVKTRRLDSSVSEGLKSEFSEKKLLTEKALPTEAVEDVEAFDIYQDVADDNICAVSQVPLLFSIKFTAETELCLVGFELLSRSCAPNTNRAKRCEFLSSNTFFDINWRLNCT